MSKQDSTAVMARRNKTLGATPLLDQGGGHMQLELRPAGHTSVMSNRAPAPDDLDYFPTPPWAARAGGELIQKLDPGDWSVWEPACGGGHMAHGLREHFTTVVESDIHQHEGGDPAFVVDFLSEEARQFEPGIDWIVTNPPFVLGDAFVRTAYAHARRGVAMLLRLVFLEGGKRYRLLHEDCPLSAVAPFSERVPMVKGRWDPDASSATAYAWFVWLKTPERPSAPIVVPIPPGTRDRLIRREDIAHFNGIADAPLLGGAAA
jgi:hypothetical protein